MPFPLETFESFVDTKITGRGYRYFMDWAVEHLEEIKENYWHAEVRGSELYQVEIGLNEQVVEIFRCSCPYDYGPVCKHEVAVLHALKMKLLNEELSETSPDKAPQPKKRQKKFRRKTVVEQIRAKLDELQPQQMRAFLQETLEDDRYLRSIFLSRFAHPENRQTKADFRKQVKHILRPAKNRRNVIPWNQVYGYMAGIRELLSRAEQQLNEGDLDRVIPVCHVIIEELVPALEYIDDSDGDVGNLIEWSFHLLEQVAEKDLKESIRIDFLKDCLTQFDDERYEGWDFGRRFLGLAIELADAAEEYHKIEQLLLKQFNQSKKEDAGADFIYSYNRERNAGQLLDLYQTMDQEEKQLEFMKENRMLSNIMARLIAYTWQHQQYDAVRIYSKEALQQFTDKPGLTTDWLEWLLKVGKAEQNIKEQQTYTKRLLLQTGKMAWYKKLKELYDKKSWNEEIKGVLHTLKSKSHWGYSGLIPSIYIEEKKWEALLEYIKSNPDLGTLQHYDSWLQNRYPDEVMGLYKQALLKFMKNNTGRKYYREACKILQRMEALGGRREVNTIVEILQEKYDNRPALQDELMKTGLTG